LIGCVNDFLTVISFLCRQLGLIVRTNHTLSTTVILGYLTLIAEMFLIQTHGVSHLEWKLALRLLKTV